MDDDEFDLHRNPVKQVGTPTRDASIDPRPEDFLPPTNAGKADPHGPEVVSPGLHGVEGVRPILGGDVPSDTDEQQKAETDHTVEVQANGTAPDETVE